MLSNMLKKASEEDPFDEDVFQLSNWLIVRACGHLEITEKACVGNLFYRLYGNVVYDYLISTTFSKGRNPHPDTLKSLLKTLIGQQKPDPQQHCT